MSELQAIEAVAALLSNAITSFAVFFSFTFAYLTVCYLAAHNLSKFQSTAVSILYIFVTVSVMLTVYGNQVAIGEIQKSHPSVAIDSLLIWDVEYWHFYIAFMFVLVTSLSLYFMYDCRKKRQADHETKN